MVRHYKERGAGIRYWEIGNEPDIGEDGGCPYRFTPENYLPYYQHTAAAILRADPDARVGGPAVANYRSPILPALMDFGASGKAPLHFVSWHIYNSDPSAVRRTDRLRPRAAGETSGAARWKRSWMNGTCLSRIRFRTRDSSRRTSWRRHGRWWMRASIIPATTTSAITTWT